MITGKTIKPLCRSGIALFAAASAVTARLMFEPFFSLPLALTAAGVFLLACGSSALNQCQERDIDSRMERTRDRPLPAGSLSFGQALGIAATTIAAGLTMLAFQSGTAAILGLFAVIWYNGIYTPLKRRTSASVLFGSLVGAIPPMIGWTAAGGSLDDPRIIALSLLLLLWQIPHFCLLLLRWADDYRRAGIPTIADALSPDRFYPIIRLWTAAVAAAALLLPFSGVVRTAPGAWSLLLTAGAVLVLAIGSFRPGDAATRPFHGMNAFLVTVMTVISLDSLFRSAFP